MTIKCARVYQEGERWGTAWALDGLRLAMTAEGRYVEAQTLLAESLALRYELGDQVGTAESLESTATLAAAQAHPEHAMRLAGAAQAIRERVGAPLSPMRRAILDHWRALLPRASMRRLPTQPG